MHTFLSALVLLLTLPLARATSEDPPPAVHPLARIAVIGASLSDGMNTGSSFADVMRCTLRRPPESVEGRANLFFFGSPVPVGTKLVAQALESEPTLVVAVDFLFWFGYGNRALEGGPLDEPGRLVLLEKGLELLEQVECPLVVGDFADMTPAVGLMLRREQVPAKETLAALNARLRAWAAERPHVVVVPLAKMVEDVRADRGFSVGTSAWPEGSAARLIQSDRLHPTREGLVVLARILSEELVRSGVAQADDFETDAGEILSRLAASTGKGTILFEIELPEGGGKGSRDLDGTGGSDGEAGSGGDGSGAAGESEGALDPALALAG